MRRKRRKDKGSVERNRKEEDGVRNGGGKSVKKGKRREKE